MYLKQLSIFNFKNYEQAELDFDPGMNAFTGDNGAGKTNLLDAIHYLSLCKSYFNYVDTQQIKLEAPYCLISGVFDKDGQIETISCGIKKDQKKQFRRNKKEYQRLSDHIGLFPLVMVSPCDSSIIMGGSEERRRFMDNVISQTDKHYLNELINYNKILFNRNIFLKRLLERAEDHMELIDVFDEQLATSGKTIFMKRQSIMKPFIEIFYRHYQFLSDAAEDVQIIYESQLMHEDLSHLLKKYRERDQVQARTTVGIHKDDIQFLIHGMPLKRFGSQGQQKSLLMALKLTQYTLLQQNKGFKPLLLLDDIFDKLDEKRTKKLMQMASNNNFGQVFLTDTNLVKVNSLFRELGVSMRLFTIEKGVVYA